MALILSQLTLNAGLLGLAQVFPERASAVVVLRRLLMAESGLPVQIRAVRHSSQV